MCECVCVCVSARRTKSPLGTAAKGCIDPSSVKFATMLHFLEQVCESGKFDVFLFSLTAIPLVPASSVGISNSLKQRLQSNVCFGFGLFWFLYWFVLDLVLGCFGFGLFRFLYFVWFWFVLVSDYFGLRIGFGFGLFWFLFGIC